MGNITVLLVDDHALVREGIRSLLQLEKDIEVVGEAGDGSEAIQKCRELRPDIILMDISMPSMGGVEATRQITGEAPEARVVILSRYDNLGYARSLLEAGAMGYVPKKTVSTDLVTAIRVVHNGDVFLHPSIASKVTRDYVQLIHSERNTDPYQRLTGREKEILKLVADGYSTRQIAERLYLTAKTILNYRKSIMEKLGVDNASPFPHVREYIP